MVSKEECVEDLREVQEANPNHFITRNFYRVKGEYSDATWNRFFGTFHEFRREAGLELSRGQHRLEKDIALHASADLYRDMQEEQIKPYVGRFVKPDDGDRFKQVLVCSDLHDVNLDPFTWGVFLDVAKRVQPDDIALAGDIFDFSEFSKYVTDPRKFDIQGAYTFVREAIFKPLREACPDSNDDFFIGNHDWRIIKHLADASPAMLTLLHDGMGLSLKDLFGLDEHKINLVARTDLGEFTPAASREAISKNFKEYYKTVVVDHHGDNGFAMSGCSGHEHHTGMVSTANLPRGPIHWVKMGCMARIDFDYQERLNKSHQSFVLWHIDRLTLQATPEHIIFGDEYVCAVGKYYFREDYDPDFAKFKASGSTDNAAFFKQLKAEKDAERSARQVERLQKWALNVKSNSEGPIRNHKEG